MTKIDKRQLKKFAEKYRKYKNAGAEIKGVYYISREEPVHSTYENADFSPKLSKIQLERERQPKYSNKWRRMSSEVV